MVAAVNTVNVAPPFTGKVRVAAERQRTRDVGVNGFLECGVTVVVRPSTPVD
jgi:hypothetical protein